MQYSFIIPYMWTESRKNYDYLQLCLTTITKVACSLDYEICICEIGPDSYIQKTNLLVSSKIKHMFVKSHGAFHRAWVLNLGARYLATGNYLILIDNDILISTHWCNGLSNYHGDVAFGWNKLNYLSKESSLKLNKTYDISNITSSRIIKTFVPTTFGAAGGVSIIKREVFFYVKGIPEDFYPYWGGEDNTFIQKLKAYHYIPTVFSAPIWHLYHPPAQNKSNKTLKTVKKFKFYTQQNWEDHYTSLEYEWGDKYNKKFIHPIILSTIQPQIESQVEPQVEPQIESQVELQIKPPRQKVHPNKWRTKIEYNQLTNKKVKTKTTYSNKKPKSSLIKTSVINVIKNRII